MQRLTAYESHFAEHSGDECDSLRKKKCAEHISVVVLPNKTLSFCRLSVNVTTMCFRFDLAVQNIFEKNTRFLSLTLQV